MKHLISLRTSTVLATGLLALGTAGAVQAAPEGAAGVIRNRSIGYVMTIENRAIYETHDAKAECPNGFNSGPRDQFKMLYPEGTKRTVVDTHLAREAEVWFPGSAKEPYPFYEVQGKTGTGMNLDGKVGPNDFTSPEGEKGIDNQLYRAIGCIRNYRAEGETAILTPQWRRAPYNIYVIELTDVDSLANDDDVTVTTYRGQDRLIADATGNSYLPGGTQTVDTRWSKRYIQKFHGKIVDGVLTTEAKDLSMPSASIYAPRDGAPDVAFHDMRFQLNITPNGASGLMGGYADVDSWYIAANETRDTNHQSYGNTSGPSMYRALHRLADAYPDPKTGENTAISAALSVTFTQVFVKHPDAKVAADMDMGKHDTRTALAKDAASREAGSR